MNILLLTIPVTFTLVLLFVLLFIKGAKSGQFDDLDTPAHAPFLDEESMEQEKNETIKEKNDKEENRA